MQHNVKYYAADHAFGTWDKAHTTNITLVDEDTIAAAANHQDACCLNFASHKRPGGGYRAVQHLAIPLKTQEEDLFRRSDLPKIMDNPQIRAYYPLKNTQGLYCTATVSKDAQLNLITPFEIAVVTVPALINPKAGDRPVTEAKLRRVLDIAADNGHKILILGAWGCGAFYNDPQYVAAIFNELLQGDFQGVFETVVFAIPNKGSANHKVFKELLGL